MITVSEVIEIYATYNYEVTEKEAEEDIKHALGDNPTYSKFVTRIHGYAQQMSLERRCDAAEADEFQSHYE